MKVAEEEAQLLARKSREAEEEIRRARESAVKVFILLHNVLYLYGNLFRVKKKS